jgi:hypothetical protein
MRSIRMSTSKVMKIRDRIYGKKHGLDKVCATRQIFFYTTSAQGDLGWSSGQAIGGSTSCAGLTSKVKHSRARKY